jgi:hypothetical protein
MNPFSSNGFPTPPVRPKKLSRQIDLEDRRELLEPDDGELSPVLPGDGSSRGRAPGPFGIFDPGTGVCCNRSLVEQLSWTVSLTDHPQKAVKVGDGDVKVDASLAPLIRRLNAIGCRTITSCEGIGDTVRAYVMFTENGGRRFAKFWHQRLAPLGYQQPVLYHELRDADWRIEIGRDYPFPNRIPVDPDGTNFTLTWKLYREEVMPDLLDALGRELQAQWHR